MQGAVAKVGEGLGFEEFGIEAEVFDGFDLDGGEAFGDFGEEEFVSCAAAAEVDGG